MPSVSHGSHTWIFQLLCSLVTVPGPSDLRGVLANDYPTLPAVRLPIPGHPDRRVQVCLLLIQSFSSAPPGSQDPKGRHVAERSRYCKHNHYQSLIIDRYIIQNYIETITILHQDHGRYFQKALLERKNQKALLRNLTLKHLLFDGGRGQRARSCQRDATAACTGQG